MRTKRNNGRNPYQFNKKLKRDKKVNVRKHKNTKRISNGIRRNQITLEIFNYHNDEKPFILLECYTFDKNRRRI